MERTAYSPAPARDREPTQRQLDVLVCVRQHLRRHQKPPTRSEIGGALGISRATADKHLQALAASGRLVLRRQWRGIFLTSLASLVSSAPPTQRGLR